MRTSPTVSLSKPKDGERVPEFTLGYFRGRNKNHIHKVLREEFKKSGITQAELARRLGKGTDVVCRVIGAPSNLTAESISDYLFAISGGELDVSVKHPFEKRHQEGGIQTNRRRIEKARPAKALQQTPIPQTNVIKLFSTVTSGTTGSPVSEASSTSTGASWELPRLTG